MTEIRTTHPYGFRTGQWAELQGMVKVKGRQCYLVVFPDYVSDMWVVSDPQGGYEFRESND